MTDLSYLSLLHSIVDIFILLKLLQLCLNQHLSDVHHLLHSERQTLHRETELFLQQDTHLWTDRQYSKRFLKLQVQPPALNVHYSVHRQLSLLFLKQAFYWRNEQIQRELMMFWTTGVPLCNRLKNATKCLMTTLLWCRYSCTELKLPLLTPSHNTNASVGWKHHKAWRIAREGQSVQYIF